MRPGLSLASCQLIRTATTAGASRVASALLCVHAIANTPAGPMEPVRSYCSIDVSLPCIQVRSAPALSLSRPAQRLLTLRPARSPSRPSDPLHRWLRQLRCLRCRSDCYRVERTSSRARFPLAEDQRLFTAHLKPALLIPNRGELWANAVSLSSSFLVAPLCLLVQAGYAPLP